MREPLGSTPLNSGSGVVSRVLLLGGPAPMPGMAAWEEVLDKNRMEKEKYTPLQGAPHFHSCVSTDSSALIPHIPSRVHNQCSVFSCQPWEESELPVPPQTPEATAEGQPGQSCSQYLPTWGQSLVEIWFSEVSDWGHLDPSRPTSVLLPSTL